MSESRVGPGRAAADGAEAAVERFFGDLLVDVALDAPVSLERLVRVLGAVQEAASARRAALRADSAAGVDAPGGATVVPVPVDRWSELAGAADLTPTDEVAAREVHRRFALAACDLRPAPGVDPLIVLPPS